MRRITVPIIAHKTITPNTMPTMAFVLRLMSSIHPKENNIIIMSFYFLGLHSQSSPSYLHSFTLHTLSQTSSPMYSERQYLEQVFSPPNGASTQSSNVLPFTEIEKKRGLFSFKR